MTDELQHHGIIGQKWGVRRYQNKDGSLTAAGKKRAKNAPSKKKSKMTDEELVKRIERLEREKKLKDLEKATSGEGKQFAQDVLKSVGKKAITQIGTAATLIIVNSLLKGKFDPIEASKYIPKPKDQW